MIIQYTDTFLCTIFTTRLYTFKICQINSKQHRSFESSPCPWFLKRKTPVYISCTYDCRATYRMRTAYVWLVIKNKRKNKYRYCAAAMFADLHSTYTRTYIHTKDLRKITYLLQADYSKKFYGSKSTGIPRFIALFKNSRFVATLRRASLSASFFQQHVLTSCLCVTFW
jgi:hypothetical protein